MKDFKTTDELITILRSRGMEVSSSAGLILLREGYYSIVNGYKAPFLDTAAMQESAHDVYRPGTRFESLYALFSFDRELRQLTFGYLIQAEAALKTAAVYAFCNAHRGTSAYLDRSSFCKPKDMLVARSFKGNRVSLHAANLNRLMETLNSKLSVKPSTGPFVAHYLTVYGEVPLWVLANDLTFGNMAHFYQLMNRSEQNAACKLLFKTTMRCDKDDRISPHDVLRAFEVLVHFRNLCAHDERLYCAKRGTDTYATMVSLLAVALPGAMVEKLKKEIAALIGRYKGELQTVEVPDLLIQLGVA